jgi:TPR repeat protein
MNAWSPKDEVKEVKWYRKAAEQNYAPAQYNMGVCYANGQGVAKDEAAAVKCWRMAAEQNVAPAQFRLGLLYSQLVRPTSPHPRTSGVLVLVY